MNPNKTKKIVNKSLLKTSKLDNSKSQITIYEILVKGKLYMKTKSLKEAIRYREDVIAIDKELRTNVNINSYSYDKLKDKCYNIETII
jgi:hypothetical protein